MYVNVRRMLTRALPLFAMLSACAIGGDTDDPTHTSLLSGTASVSLSSSSSRVSLTSGSQWSLSKTGSLSGNTVTWNITATKTATQSGQLLIQGQMTVSNTGNGPATIGNIVVNLQKRQGNSWVTKSSDIANATQGDDATSAKIHAAASSENKSSFLENGASGALEFMDATNNTLFSLTPQVLVGAGQSKTLLFSAAFNNNNSALQLTAGTQIRAEVIVTFGNATQSGNSTANVDINGNGVIDSDEARVRSVPSRITLTVPAQVNGNATPTLSDTANDIAASGTASFSNVQFNLGATSGTVTATVNGGASGGSITNCAHLTSPDQTVNAGGTFTTIQGINLQSCSTIDVGGTPPTCTVPGAPGCPWNNNEAFTRTQLAWDSSTSWFASYDSIYASSLGEVEVGLPGSSGFSLRFTGPDKVTAFFVQSGPAAALNADLSDTTSSSSGGFGGQTLALRMNVDFSAAGALGGSVTLGSLRLCDMTDTSLNNRTVSDVLGLANTLLGGGSNGYQIADITDLVTSLNNAFVDGVPSSFAAAHIRNGSCP